MLSMRGAKAPSEQTSCSKNRCSCNGMMYDVRFEGRETGDGRWEMGDGDIESR